MTTTMQTAQISKPGGEWELVERVIPEPGAGHVRVKVEACGMCHSDVFVKEGLWPGLQYPRVPGHEIAGHIDAVGDNVDAWRQGQRVGVGWHGGHCFVCDQCRRGDFAMCVQSQGHGHRLRRRIRRIHDRTGGNPRGDSRRIAGRGSGTVHVCGRHGLQRAAPCWRARRRGRRRARHRRTRASRRAVRAADGL